MIYESVAQMFKRQNEDRKNGVKHTPLHTLQECCEEAGITTQKFHRLAAKHPDAPQPIVKTTKAAWRGQKLYYSKSKFLRWVNQVSQPKEKAMPDIKSALESALSKTAQAWAADDEAHATIQPAPEKHMTLGEQLRAKFEAMPLPKPVAPAEEEKQDHRITTNVSRETFYFVRDNPGHTREQATAQLTAQGFNSKSVSSLLGQMMRGRIIMEDADGKLTTVTREYVPVQSVLTKKIAGKYTQRIKPKDWPTSKPKRKVVLIKRPDPAVVAIDTLPKLDKPEWSPASVIDGLNVRQAMAVYDELRKIFGE